MDNRRCPSCSEPASPSGCQCHRIPSNLELVQKVLHKPMKPRSCIRKCAQYSIKAIPAGGNNIDCLCNFNDSLCSCSDHRLKRWEQELQLRNNLAERLMQRTGKSACELLFNRPVTVDVRDKLMMQRLMDHAESQKPKARQTQAVIKEQLPNGCFIEEMTSAKPKRKKYFEITGLPAGVKCELIGENCCVRRSGWIVSRTVREQIAANSKNIKRVVPFFPDIEYLQVIGKKMTIYEKEMEEHENVVEEVVDSNGAPPNDNCSRFAAACLEDTQEGDLYVCGTQLANSSEEAEEDNEKAAYKIYSCFRDRINQSEEDDSLYAANSCSDNNFDMYEELISNRARCHSLFFGL